MRLSMSICDEIKIAMIAIDEAMILEINATIALHSDLKLINDRVSSVKEICQKVCCTFRVQCYSLELARSVTLQNNS